MQGSGLTDRTPPGRATSLLLLITPFLVTFLGLSLDPGLCRGQFYQGCNLGELRLKSLLEHRIAVQKFERLFQCDLVSPADKMEILFPLFGCHAVLPPFLGSI